MRDLFRALHDEATALAVDVFEHGRMAHPCAHLVYSAYDDLDEDTPPDWRTDWRRHWQMPETYWGRYEPFPRHGTNFDEWFGCQGSHCGE